MNFSRRKFVQGVLLGGAALSGGVATSAIGAKQRQPLISKAPTLDGFGPSPAPSALNSQSLALGKFFPSLLDANASQGPFIINTLSGSGPLLDHIRQGEAGNSVFLRKNDARATIPWAPLFIRENSPFLQLPLSVKRQIDCSDLLVMNESSPRYPIYGNKARKYEFLLPNFKWSGSKRLGTMGAVSSNHALQFALANRIANLTGSGQPLNCSLDLLLFEVPDVPTDLARLAVLRSLSQNVAIAQNDIEFAGEAAQEYTKNWLHPYTDALVPPGGSNEISVLGHINAIAELAVALQTTQMWASPPDVIFVAMGSGSTVLGILLGVHLMGWTTKVVGVADQDKHFLTRWLVNQQPSLPFVEGNVAKLTRSTINWLQKIRFPGISADVARILERDIFVADSTSWKPGYGLLESNDVAWAEELKDAGLTLDPVFTLKAWRSLLKMSKDGALKNKKILFWNTYNSFDYAPPLLSSLG